MGHVTPQVLVREHPRLKFQKIRQNTLLQCSTCWYLRPTLALLVYLRDLPIVTKDRKAPRNARFSPASPKSSLRGGRGTPSTTAQGFTGAPSILMFIYRWKIIGFFVGGKMFIVFSWGPFCFILGRGFHFSWMF